MAKKTRSGFVHANVASGRTSLAPGVGMSEFDMTLNRFDTEPGVAGHLMLRFENRRSDYDRPYLQHVWLSLDLATAQSMAQAILAVAALPAKGKQITVRVSERSVIVRVR